MNGVKKEQIEREVSVAGSRGEGAEEWRAGQANSSNIQITPDYDAVRDAAL